MSNLQIILSNITKSYKNIPVLNDINLTINQDDFIAVVGKSGSGKSTLMNILGLIEFWDDGEYKLNGEKIQNYKDHSSIRLEKIGFIYQNYNLISTLTCKENILLPTLYAKKENRCVSIEYLAKKLEIQHLLDTPVTVLSGGEKQRVAIARALILNPSILIADEPTGNLDKENKNIVLELLNTSYKQGCAVVIITHDYSVAGQSQIIYELREGILYEKV